jgi:hypothetical protein
MLRYEFEKLAKVQGQVSELAYQDIEWSYMRTEETKQDFVARIFGTKRNSLRQIERKWADFCCTENRMALRGNWTATEEMLAHHDSLIRSHVHGCFKYYD